MKNRVDSISLNQSNQNTLLHSCVAVYTDFLFFKILETTLQISAPKRTNLYYFKGTIFMMVSQKTALSLILCFIHSFSALEIKVPFYGAQILSAIDCSYSLFHFWHYQLKGMHNMCEHLELKILKRKLENGNYSEK